MTDDEQDGADALDDDRDDAADDDDDTDDSAPAAATADDNEDFDLDAPPRQAAARPPPPKNRGGRPRKNRQEQPMSQKGTTTRAITLGEIPRDEVIALQGAHTEVALTVKRRTPNGQHTTIRGGIRLPPHALFDLQTAVVAFAGGGQFTFEVSDPITKARLVTMWTELYDGTPRPPKQGYTLAWNDPKAQLEVVPDTRAMGLYDGDPTGGSQQIHNQPGAWAQPGSHGPFGAPRAPDPTFGSYDAAGNLLPPPADAGVPKWMQTYPAKVQWQFLAEQYRDANKEKQQMGNNGAPIALDWVHQGLNEQGELKAKLAKFEERTAQQDENHRREIEKMRLELQARLDLEREARTRAERQLEVAQTEGKYAALEARIAALSVAPKGPNMAETLTALAPLAAAFVPLLVKSRENEATMANADRDQQTKLVTAVLTQKPPPSMFEQITPLLPVLVPLFMEYMKNNSPAKQAEMLSAATEQQMLLLQMIGAQMKDSMPDAPPAWQPLIDLAVNGLGVWMSNRGAAPPQRQLAAPPQQRQLAAQSGPAAVTPARASAMDDVFTSLAQSDPQAAHMTRLIWQQLPQDQGFHSHEWLTLIFNLHAKVAVDEVSQLIAGHLYHCRSFNVMPPALKDVFELDKSESLLRSLLGIMPINSQDPDYCSAVIAAVTEHIREMETEEDDDEVDEDEAEEADVIETSASAEA